MKEAVFFSLVILLIWFLFFYLPSKNRKLSKEDYMPCFNRKQCREVHSDYFESFPMPDVNAVNGYSYVRYCNICNWSADISTQGFLLEKHLRENK